MQTTRELLEGIAECFNEPRYCGMERMILSDLNINFKNSAFGADLDVLTDSLGLLDCVIGPT